MFGETDCPGLLGVWIRVPRMVTAARIDAEARATAHALIQGYLGPGHKVISMGDFYSGWFRALKAAREQGQAD